MKLKILTLLFALLVNSICYNLQAQDRQSRAKDFILNQKNQNAKKKNVLKTSTLSNFPKSISKIFGANVAVSNVKYTGASSAIGNFTDPTNSFGIDSGIVLTTGSINNIYGPNNSSCASQSNNTLGDPNLDAISTTPTYDACVIEFDFIPTDSIINCNYVFASEEYPEYVGTQFNDIFGFFISGPGINGVQNLALIPGTSIPVAINNINDTSYSQYYVDNTNGTVLQYDGYTTKMGINYKVIPGQQYHFKIAIADVGDNIYDSGVFIESGSFQSIPIPIPCNAYFQYNIDSLNSVNFTNLSSGNNINSWSWNFGDGTSSTVQNPTHIYASNGTYNVCLTISGDSCQSSYCNYVTVGYDSLNSACQAYYYAYSDSSMTAPTNYYFVDNSTGNPTNWYWDFGDGTTGTGQYPHHTYNTNGTYDVCLTISGDSCQSTFCNYITIGYDSLNTGCQANFIMYPDSVTPHHYYIVNMSSGVQPLSYSWNWGDGTYDSTPYPSHTYSVAGIYTICLTISSDSNSCSSTYCDSMYIQKTTNTIISVNVIPQSTSGIHENIKKNDIAIYPNPVTDNLNISIDKSLSGTTTVSILNLMGQVIQTANVVNETKGNVISINTSSLPKGLYFVQLNCNGQIETGRFAK